MGEYQEQANPEYDQFEEQPESLFGEDNYGTICEVPDIGEDGTIRLSPAEYERLTGKTPPKVAMRRPVEG